MSFRAKRLIKKIISWSGLFFFALAAYMLYRQLSKYHLQDIQDALMSIPRQNLLYACAASFIGYVALSSYDFLALKYIGRKLAAWKWIFVGFIGFSVSNNAGHAIVSGGAIRYRLYTRWRFHGEDIVKMVTFSGFTYLVACFFLVIMGYVLTPDHAFGEGSVSKMTTTVTALCSAAGLGVYFWASLFYKKPIVIKDMASLVLYFSLIPFVNIPFDVFIGVFLIAQVLGVFSQVPGGLGVFEGLFMFIIPGEHNQAMLFGALIAYRIIYYLLPLVFSGIILLIYELGLRHAKKLRLRKSAASPS